jgi:DNA-binding CsgD family transcriptional regulator
LNLAIALYAAGQVDRADGLLEDAVQHARQIGQHWAEATALTYLALIAFEVRADGERAASFVRSALPVASRVADTWVTAHLLELAAWLAAQRSAGLAAQLLGGSETLRERTGARLHPAFRSGHERWLKAIWGDEDIDEAMAEGGAMTEEALLRLALTATRETLRGKSTAPRVTPDYGPLSNREREIASLVALGLTSREIADRLVVGERTVETHVDHIRAKLGVRSRAAIAAWAVERGLAVRDA